MHGEQIFLDDTLGIQNAIHRLREIPDSSSCIVYTPGRIQQNDFFDGRQVYRNVLESGKSLLCLIQKFAGTESNIVVITESTQFNNKLNLFGAELWGIARSVALEPRKISINVIDVFPSIEDTSETLQEVISKLRHDHAQLPQEILIMGNKVHFGSIHRGRSNMSQKEIEIEIPVRREKHSMRGNHNELMCRQDSPAGTRYDCDTVEVRVVAACLNPVQLQSQSNHQLSYHSGVVTKLWKTMKNTNPMHVVERIGHCLMPSRKPNAQQNEEIICCLPGKMKQIVTVPKELVCKRKEFQSYTPGLLQSSILALHLLEALEGERSIIGISGDENAVVLHLLGHMLKDSKIALRQIHELKQLPQEDVDKACIVSLKEFTLFDLLPYVHCLRGISKMVCLQKTAELLLEEDVPFQVTLLASADVFELHRLRRRFKDAQKFVKKLEKHKSFKSIIQEMEYTNKNAYFLQVEKQDDSPNDVEKPMQLVRRKSSYVVIGGQTGLGWLLVKHLSKHGAERIFIVSRRTPDLKTRTKMENIEALYQTNITAIQADICNIFQLQEKFEIMKSVTKSCPIRGIYHGGATTADSFAIGMSMEQFEIPLRPKILGTLNLHEVSKDLDLDHFVMHSSVASIFGNSGQCNYAAGNAFQDGLALFRRSVGLPAQAIRWGALDVGLASDSFTRESLKMKGFLPLPSNQICECFAKCLFSTEVLPIIAYMDWATFITINIQTMHKKFHVFLGKNKTTPADINKHAVREDENDVMDDVVNCVAGVFALHSTQIQVDIPIIDFGLDSQKGTELASMMFSKTNVRVPYIYLATNNHTVRDVARFIKEKQENHVADEGGTMNDLSTANVTTHWDQYVIDQFKSESYLEYRSVVLETWCHQRQSDGLRVCMQHLLKLHPDIRTQYRFATDDTGTDVLIKEVIDMEEAVLPIEFTEKDPMSVFPRKVNDESFRIVLGGSRDKLTLTLLFCPLTFDMPSIGTIADCTILLLNLNEKKSLTSEMVANLFPVRQPKYEELLKLDDKEMKTAWSKHLTVHPLPHTVTINTSECPNLAETRSLSEMLTRALQHYAQVENVSIYQMVCCLLQLALSFALGSSRVTLLVQTDIRGYLGLPLDTVGMYSNIVPLSTKVDKTVTFAEFIKETISSWNHAKQNMAYPFPKIKSMDTFDASVHQLLLCSFLDLSNKSHENDKHNKIASFAPGCMSTTEMEILAVLLPEGLIIKAQCKTGGVMERHANKILDIFMRLTENVIMNPEEEVQELAHGRRVQTVEAVCDSGTVQNLFIKQAYY